MADKAENTRVDRPEGAQVDTRVAQLIIDIVRCQTVYLRTNFNRDPTSVVIGRAERQTLNDYFDALGHTQKAEGDGVDRLFGLEVKVDGDVGVRVG